jgi:hypothetical protein
MQVDTFLKIGKTHKICEDYILSGTKPFPYIIISDGCSSSEGTDMGARLLCFLAQQYIRFKASPNKDFIPDHKEMGLWIIHNAELVSKQLGLHPGSLDATLIIAYKKFDANDIRVHFYGDACVVLFSTKSDFARMESIEYSKDAPDYLSYMLNNERRKLFHNMNQDKIYKTYIQNTINEERFSYDCESACESAFWYQLNKDHNGLLIASDGLAKFYNRETGLFPFPSHVKNFFSFKITKGEFLKRRANAELKSLAKNEIYNADDLSIGGFLLEG